MRWIVRGVLAAVFFALIFPATVGEGIVGARFAAAAEDIFPTGDHAGTVADPWLLYNSPTVQVKFDDTYTAFGVVLVRIEADVLQPDGVTLVKTAIADNATGFVPVDGAFSIPIRSYVEDLPNGIYGIRLRIADKYGNFSDYSDIYFMSKLWRTLEPPGGCAIVR